VMRHLCPTSNFCGEWWVVAVVLCNQFAQKAINSNLP